MKRRNLNRISALASLAAGLVFLAGCQATGSQRYNLAQYAPVIDVKGHGYDVATYYNDLEECRVLGMRVQMNYEEQRRKEQAARNQAAVVGAVAGAVVGHVVGDHNDYHVGRSTTAGAATGALIGAESSPVDLDRTMAKFGPTAIVDRCMSDRGYTILSAEGFGGG